MRRHASLVVVGILAAALAAAGVRSAYRPPSRVLRPPNAAAALGANYDWALREARKEPSANGFWVGYCIQKLMDENSQIGSSHSGRRGLEPSIDDILAGRTAAAEAEGESLRRTAGRVLDEMDRPGKPEKKVPKELGVFLRFGGGGEAALRDVDLSTLDLSFDFEAAPLYWLSRAGEDESLALIKGLYARFEADEVREGLLAAAGCHSTARLVAPFLEGILRGEGPDDLRRNAAFWLGQQGDPEALRILVRTARDDKSEEVREGAVFSISQVDLPEAVDELIALAQEAERLDVRKKAVFWLGQVASKKSGEALEKFARTGGDIEVQEQAVFALSQLPGNQGVDALIKLAKTHPNPRIRKKAVFWLGECDDPRALETLIAIVRGK